MSLLALALICGCTEEVSTVIYLELLYPEEASGGGRDPLDGVETLSVRVVPSDDTDEIVRELSRPASGEWSGMDTGIELGLVSIPWARVVVEGLSEEREVLSAGETIPIPVMSGKSGRLSLFFQRLGTSGVAPALSQPWSQHSATYLEGGGVLIVGGGEETPATEAWVYALDLYESIEVASLDTPRNLCEVAGFGGTKALLVGGTRASTTALTYTPTSNAWTQMDVPTELQGSWPRPMVTELPGESVLAVRDGAVARFDPDSPVDAVGELQSDIARSGETLTFVASGLAVLVGEDGAVGIDYFRGTEVSLEQPPSGGRRGHAAAALADGRLVLAGGETDEGFLEDVEVYDHTGVGSWTLLEGLLAGQARRGARLTLLRDGRLLLSGGENEAGELARDILVVDVDAGEVSPIELVTPRRWHTATALPTGAVMIAGGESEGGDVLDSVEIVRPESQAPGL